MHEKAIEVMNEQIHLDMDAIDAYASAIDACETAELELRLGEFRGDHERHVRELAECVRRYGGEPSVRRDVKGFFIKGFTAITSMGDRSAIYAMRANEELTNRFYDQALQNDLPDDVRLLLQRNRDDERRHLGWLKAVIVARAWDTKAA
jgi:demethoxyubiquinone hydroxylase (CLK1/Coq7/Cat5 family)